MLNDPTMSKLYEMKLKGMAEAYEEQRCRSGIEDLSFQERFAMLVERQWIWKETRALATRLAYARLKQPACIEELDFRTSRGLKRAQIDQLATCDWVRYHQNVIVTGPTGCGKTFVACALAQKACREGHRALYFYAPKLFRALSVAQTDGSLPRLLKKIAAAQLLLVDDWGMAKLNELQHREFLEILFSTHSTKERSTMIDDAAGTAKPGISPALGITPVNEEHARRIIDYYLRNVYDLRNDRRP